VALDKPFSQRFSLFIVRLSILNHSHPLWCLECKPKMTPIIIPLPWAHFLFFSFFFSKSSNWSSSHVIISSFHVIITFSRVSPCSTLGLHQPSSNHNSWQRLVPMFHQLFKTKLGLSSLTVEALANCTLNFPIKNVLSIARYGLEPLRNPSMQGCNAKKNFLNLILSLMVWWSILTKLPGQQVLICALNL
jgi:hypothetical protein